MVRCFKHVREEGKEGGGESRACKGATSQSCFLSCVSSMLRSEITLC